MRYEIWQIATGEFGLFAGLDVVEASALTSLGMHVVKTKEFETEEEGIAWFIDFRREKCPSLRAEPISQLELQLKAKDLLLPSGSGEGEDLL